MILGKYLRGAILMLSALIAVTVIVTNVITQALTVVDRINNGEIPAEVGTIAELVSKSANGAEGSLLNIATLVVGAVWLFGIIDSYRIGISQEREPIS
jgi:hypothetical protein